MNNATIQLKIKQRLNKLDSQDYDNLECWQIVEAFNKGQVNWCRRNLHGLNVKQEGDEGSKRRIDDLQILLTDQKMTFKKEDGYYLSEVLPENYMEWKRIDGAGESECCDGKRNMVVYLVQDANVPMLLRDNLKKPSYNWGETFCTLKGNKIRVYTNNEFTYETAFLTYYRQPRRIEIQGCVDPYTQLESTQNVECEFKDDIIELFVDEAVKILAGDIESINQMGIASKNVEENN